MIKKMINKKTSKIILKINDKKMKNK